MVKHHCNRDWQDAVIRGMYLTGKPVSDICAKVGLTTLTVNRHLAKLRQQWLADSQEEHAIRVSMELAKIDHLEETYWDAWEKSKASRVKVAIKQQGDPMVVVEKTRSREKSVGQTQFLEGVRWCIERRSKLLGLDAPERRQIFGAMTLQVYEQIVDARDGPMLPESTVEQLTDNVTDNVTDVLLEEIVEGEVAT